MTNQQQSLHDEHRDLFPELAALQSLADAVDTIPEDEVRRRLDGILTFLTGRLLAQAQAEDQVIYPAMERVLGASATKTTVDHAAIRRLTEALQAERHNMETRPFTHTDQQALRHTLFALHALISLHLAQEDDVFWPALDGALSAEAVHELAEAVDRTAQTHKEPATPPTEEMNAL
jgi:iron-sulfur cluster repair protein YtfE (RIC family)